MADLKTTKEKRQEKIARLQARIEKEKVLLNTATRKERTGQLVSAGVLLELIYTNTTPEGREEIKSQAEKYLTDNRNLQRTRAMFERLDGQFT